VARDLVQKQAMAAVDSGGQTAEASEVAAEANRALKSPAVGRARLRAFAAGGLLVAEQGQWRLKPG
jgi:hypothetical protein